jgi:protein tyrosine/serine phosphatase
MKKKILFVALLVVLVLAGKYVYDVNINHNFKEITEGKVYKSGVIPPNEIADYAKKYNIKSIIDLRFPGTNDLVNNPEIPSELTAEEDAVKSIEGLQYFNVGSDQVPKQEVIDRYLEIMDNPDNYPVLIHCYHGEGRAPLFSALYRIEYEGWNNNDARKATRFMTKFSSFDEGKPKGDFLLNYKPRNK